MYNVQRVPIDEFLVFLACGFIYLCTFFIHIPINKFFTALLFFCIMSRAVNQSVTLYYRYVSPVSLVFYGLFGFLYIQQYESHGVVLNNGLISLLMIYLSVLFFSSLRLESTDKIRFYIGGMILIFSLLTIRPMSKGGYFIQTGAGGILSCFVVLAGFVLTFDSEDKRCKNLSYILFIFLIVLSGRGTILSGLLFAILYKAKNLFLLIKIAIGMLMLFGMTYLVMPGLRIFELHLSGRGVHWVKILREYNPDNFFYGAGHGSAIDILLSYGLGDSMASPHNEFIRIFFDFGFIGIVLLLIGLFSMAFVGGRKKMAYLVVLIIPFSFDNPITYFAPFIFIIIMSCTLNNKSVQVVRSQ